MFGGIVYSNNGRRGREKLIPYNQGESSLKRTNAWKAGSLESKANSKVSHVFLQI